jgi:hypothetical protein
MLTSLRKVDGTATVPAKRIGMLCRLAVPTLPEESNWKPRLARKVDPDIASLSAQQFDELEYGSGASRGAVGVNFVALAVDNGDPSPGSRAGLPYILLLFHRKGNDALSPQKTFD